MKNNILKIISIITILVIVMLAIKINVKSVYITFKDNTGYYIGK